MIQNDALCDACCRQHGRIFETCTNGCHIRDLFEELKAERDAAVADLAYISHCDTCKFSKVNYNSEPCKDCGGDFWEWRGLSLETKTSDKEVE